MDDMRMLDTDKGVDFDKRDGNRRNALHCASIGLLHVYVDENLAATQPYMQIADYLMDHLSALLVFVSQERRQLHTASARAT